MSEIPPKRRLGWSKSLWIAIGRRWATRRMERARRAAFAQLLARRDDRMLRDIGIDRCGVERLSCGCWTGDRREGDPWWE
ncbi:hypothetical protein Sa4125_46310 [Aureimonas sp. SA4125]|uniref:hypothetical protein n=1 Tax=Aureimonas sp. SA4125 TaxID=2826993 RepID=UPI001CC3A36C|nr:hypothetical protein [Aureimonas sp. SA4125]BDA87089.1 hypothetical protein Sa4125_46310 [Aureimonas sp. SA4125]